MYNIKVKEILIHVFCFQVFVVSSSFHSCKVSFTANIGTSLHYGCVAHEKM